MYTHTCTAKDDSDCMPNLCQNGGKCFNDMNGDFRCDCVGTKHIGPLCETQSDSNVIRINVTTVRNKTQLHIPVDVNLTCQATSIPSPMYHWYKDGQLIEGKIDSYLYIKDFSVDDRGNYSCDAINVNGNDFSSTHLLTIEGIYLIINLGTFGNADYNFHINVGVRQYLITVDHPNMSRTNIREVSTLV